MLSTGVGWRVLEKSSLDCSGDGFGSFFFFWATVEVECLDLDIGDDNANISSSLPESYASSPRSELWPVMCFISHSGNPKDFNFLKRLFFLQSRLLFFYLRTVLLMVTSFHSVQHCVYCIDPHGLIFIPNISQRCPYFAIQLDVYF